MGKSEPAASQPVSRGSVHVAARNVYNFNGDGLGGGFPTERGEETELEFIRQSAKLAAALIELHADVIGLTEIENDGYGPTSALQDLVDGLNLVSPAGTTYSFVAPSFDLGSDPIKVALIYLTETITLTGAAATTNTTPFDAYRPSLAQTFEERATGEQFTVVVNHFEPKDCAGAVGLDLDQGDGRAATTTSARR